MGKKKDFSDGLSRRGFLKALGVSGTGMLVPAVAGASTQRVPEPSDGELATLLDISKCIGCGECVAACRESNADKFPEPKKPFPKIVPAKRAKPEDWSEKRDIDDRLTPYNWLFIQNVAVEYNGEEYDLNIPRRCMHCQNPPCANLCPFGAANKELNGITRISDQLCMGGAKCRAVCPWHIPQRQSGVGLYLDLMPRFAGNGVMYKCDRCYQLLETGSLPACISACPEDVQTIGPRHEIVAKAKALAKEMNGFIYGLDENGGTNTLYVSPVPFDLLDAAVDSGKGRPHLAPVDDVMRDETTLATATVLAPIAGIVAGVLGVGATLLKSSEEDTTDES
ncbi:4Fe-4S dicluster domain-containing protein [Pseudodesulfovibrio sp. JC047]|uniref:4Fe-4S dicluster domain-containing protein n=1 Tax=Pseudodesulfovibrio sp. JC047 TaxID=2683199 RepID=UPI0013D83AC3|nr:4Fe-4S dicluster domain-containing protein [Pseudodesulfovibrio sp. JC047]NDV19899.1 4Fe-4S dicluster domain-containing protein [Pseudodesulfovibrio sp. JC047]